MSKKTVNTPADSKNEKLKHNEKDRMKENTVHTQDAEKEEKKDIKSEKETKDTKHTESKPAHSREKELKKKIDESEQAARDWQEKYIRLSAEFDNYRKRTLKEKADLILMANANLLKDILPVVDDFERGIDHIDKSNDLEALKQGIHLIYTKFSEFLKQKGIKEIEALGQPFNLDYHEAMTKIPAPAEKDKGKVIDVIEKGYLLNDEVIRYAKVVVGD